MKYLFAVLFLFSAIAYSHQDTIIRLEKGNLIGLPALYSPAKFDSETFSLEIAGISTQFPECIKSFFVLAEGESLSISASWYHDSSFSGLPPYLVFTAHDEKYTSRRGLLFNLKTVQPIETEFAYGSLPEEKQCLKQFKKDVR